MIFNSLTFIVFLIISVALYWALDRKPRLYFLCAASILFYGFWDFRFVPLLLLSVVLDYSAGRIMGALPDGRRRWAVLAVAVTANLTLLVVFKYLIFFTDQLNGLAAYLNGGATAAPAFSLPFHIILPLGISFYTFQSMSYSVDVFRRHIPAERDFALFCAYVIYFPQLVAGPILRAGEVIWQLDKRPGFSWNDLSDGLVRVVVGLFFKVVIADNLASLVDEGFALDPAHLGALDVLTLAFLFGFQIYFDFAGYSHIAIGAARMMGIQFPENFDFPYVADSPRDFWRRWHISLSSWIRDYLYLPLCGATAGRQSVHGLDVAARVRTESVRRVAALWATWVLMGFWHGANWTFAVWGIWHATLITLHRLCARIVPFRAPPVLTWAITLPLVMLGWIPFRAESLGQAVDLWTRLLSTQFWIKPSWSGGGFPFWLGMHRDCYYAAAAVMAGILVTWAFRKYAMPRIRGHHPALEIGQLLLLAALSPLVYVFLRPTAQFIYFQF